MIQITPQMRVLVAIEPVDGRKGIDSLAQLCQEKLAELGEKDQTFHWLEKAYSEKAESLGVIKIVRSMDRYRSDPRYVDLLKRMGLPPQ